MTIQKQLNDALQELFNTAYATAHAIVGANTALVAYQKTLKAPTVEDPNERIKVLEQYLKSICIAVGEDSWDNLVSAINALRSKHDLMVTRAEAAESFQAYKQRLVDTEDFHAGYEAGIRDQKTGRDIAEEYRTKAETERDALRAQIAAAMSCQTNIDLANDAFWASKKVGGTLNDRLQRAICAALIVTNDTDAITAALNKGSL